VLVGLFIFLFVLIRNDAAQTRKAAIVVEKVAAIAVSDGQTWVENPRLHSDLAPREKALPRATFAIQLHRYG